MDSETQPASTPAESDALAILKERERVAAEEAAKKKEQEAIEAAKKAEESRLNQLKVPQMYDELVEEVNESFKVLSAIDKPALKANARPLAILDHEAAAPEPKQSWWDRLIFGKRKPEPPTRDIPVWSVSSGMVGSRFLRVFLGIDDGVIYAQSSRDRYALGLTREQLEGVSYYEMQSIIENVQSHRNRAVTQHELEQIVLAHNARVAEYEAQQSSSTTLLEP